MLFTLIVCTYILGITGFFAFMAIVVSLIDDKGINPHKVASIWSQGILLGCGIHVKVRGISNIDPSRSYIYMANHQSNFDIPVILAHLPVQFRWLAKHDLFKIPLFGYSMGRAGYISINRTDRISAFRSLKKAAKIIKNGVSVVIFPEGTRSRDGRLQSFKKGGFILAIESQTPIVPVIIHGTYTIMSKNGWQITPGDVLMEIRPPIDTSAYTLRTKDALIEKVRTEINDAIRHR